MNIKEKIQDIENDILCKIFRQNQSIFTYHVRPQRAEDYEIERVDYARGKNVGIIIQGNICTKYNFTYENIKLYKRMFPYCHIVLSTWSNEDSSLINKIAQLGIEIIQSDIPEIEGHGHLNYQLKSTSEAIKLLKEMGCDYILKTRTDQRICSEMSITYLIDMVNMYPTNKEITNAGRIAVCSNGCFFGRLYNVTDMLLFGRTTDIEKYFSAPKDLRNGIDYLQDDQIEYSKNRPGEIYLSTHYIESLGFELKWTEKDSNYFIKELFVIVDSESLDWLWLKYSRNEYRWRKYNNRVLRPMTHKDWLKLYMEDRYD